MQAGGPRSDQLPQEECCAVTASVQVARVDDTGVAELIGEVKPAHPDPLTNRAVWGGGAHQNLHSAGQGGGDTAVHYVARGGGPEQHGS